MGPATNGQVLCCFSFSAALSRAPTSMSPSVKRQKKKRTRLRVWRRRWNLRLTAPRHGAGRCCWIISVFMSLAFVLPVSLSLSLSLSVLRHCASGLIYTSAASPTLSFIQPSACVLGFFFASFFSGVVFRGRPSNRVVTGRRLRPFSIISLLGSKTETDRQRERERERQK